MKFSFSFFKKKENKLENKNFNRKKYLKSFFLVFLLFLIILTPNQIVYAGWAECIIAYAFCMLNPFCLLISAMYSLIYIFVFILFMVSALVAGIGAWLVDVMLNPSLYTTIFGSDAIRVGWDTIRSFCNMLYILIFLVIAFSSILRIESYNWKSLLMKFFISLFLINFSMMVTQLVIDFGQIFMYEFYSWMGSFSTGKGTGLTSIINTFTDTYVTNIITPTDPFSAVCNRISFNLIIGFLSAVVYTFMLGCTFFMMAGFLMVRLIVLCLLIVFSPFAFFSIILPSTRKHWSNWGGTLFKYVMFGPIFIFLVYIATVLASQSFNNPTIPNNGGFWDYLQSMIGVFPAALIGTIISNFIAIGMLWAALPITQSLGAIAGSAAISGAVGFGSMAMKTYGAGRLTAGWGKKAAGGVASRTRVGEWADSVKEKAYRGIGKIPGGQGIAIGGLAGMEKKKDEKSKSLEKKYGDVDLKNLDLELLKAKADSKLGTTDDKALVLKVAAAQGKLGDKDKDGNFIYGKHINDAERSMSKKDISEITGKNLQFSTMTTAGQDKIKELKDKEHLTQEQAEEKVMRDKMADLIREGKQHEVQDLDNPLSLKAWHESQDPDQRKGAISKMAKGDQRNKMQEGYMKMASSAGDEGKEVEYRVNAVRLGKDLDKAFEGVTDKKREVAFSKFDAKDISKLTDKQLRDNGHLVDNSKIATINRGDEGQEKIKIIREAKNREMGKLESNENVKIFLKNEKDLESEEGKKIKMKVR